MLQKNVEGGRYLHSQTSLKEIEGNSDNPHFEGEKEQLLWQKVN